MSAGERLPFQQAYDYAIEIADQLRPKVERLKAVGSLRRKSFTVGDLEFVVEPFFEHDLFGGDPKPILDPLRTVLRGLGEWKKGGDRMMQVGDVLGIPGLTLDLYIVHPPAEWGSILAIRTGPVALGTLCMMALNKRGYNHRDGRVLKADVPVPTPTEEEFFQLAGIPCLPPVRRDEQAIQLKRKESRS